MEYVAPIGGDPNDPYIDANPALGVEGSPVPAAAIEHPMREIMNVIQAAGLTPDHEDLTQLAAAITALISSGSVPDASTTVKGKVELATNAETQAGSDTVRAITPAALKSVTDLLAPLLSPLFTGDPRGPTPAQFDNDTSLATTEFVQRAIGNMRNGVGLSSSQTLNASHIGAWLAPVAGGLTFTLPLTSSVEPGSIIYIDGNGYGCTVQRQGSNVINVAGTGLTSITVAQGDTIELVYGSTGNWYVKSGETRLSRSSAFASSIGAAGYQKLPSGLILQQGTFTSSGTAGNPVGVTFPIAFPTAVRSIQISAENAATTNTAAWHSNPSASGFDGRCIIASRTCRWVAIGD